MAESRIVWFLCTHLQIISKEMVIKTKQNMDLRIQRAIKMMMHVLSSVSAPKMRVHEFYKNKRSIN